MRFWVIAAIVLLCIAVTLLGGCVTEQAVRRGADANDRAVRSAEFVLCQGASVGAIRRAYGDRPTVWDALCRSGDDFRPTD